MPTLAELRARTGPKPRPKCTQTVTLVEGQHMLDRTKVLNEELVDLLVRVSGTRDENGDLAGPPRKAGENSIPPRAEEIRNELAELARDLPDLQGVLDLVGLEGGEWHQFKENNPPRSESKADERLAYNLCDSAALFASLGQFVHAWNGEELKPGDWDGWLAESITYADRRDLVTAVVEMHEDGVKRAPKLPNGSSGTESSTTD